MPADWGTCYWCSKPLSPATFHHIGPKQRDCCRDCWSRPSSHYRRIYGLKASEKSVEREVKRASGEA